MKIDKKAAGLAILFAALSVLILADTSISSARTDNGAAAVALSSSTGAAWYNMQWPYRKKIAIDHAKVSGSSELVRFPILLSTTDPELRFSSNGGHVGKSNGGDIAFTSADGFTKLNHEIERYVPDTGELLAWIEVPSLSVLADTDLYLYYGNPSATDSRTSPVPGRTASAWFST